MVLKTKSSSLEGESSIIKLVRKLIHVIILEIKWDDAFQANHKLLVTSINWQVIVFFFFLGSSSRITVIIPPPGRDTVGRPRVRSGYLGEWLLSTRCTSWIFRLHIIKGFLRRKMENTRLCLAGITISVILLSSVVLNGGSTLAYELSPAASSTRRRDNGVQTVLDLLDFAQEEEERHLQEEYADQIHNHQREKRFPRIVSFYILL